MVIPFKWEKWQVDKNRTFLKFRTNFQEEKMNLTSWKWFLLKNTELEEQLLFAAFFNLTQLVRTLFSKNVPKLCRFTITVGSFPCHEGCNTQWVGTNTFIEAPGHFTVEWSVWPCFENWWTTLVRWVYLRALRALVSLFQNHCSEQNYISYNYSALCKNINF